jgi:Ca2+-binding RTX toxin-like protein
MHSGVNFIDAGLGDDTVTGGGGADTISGGDGNDTLSGGNGDNTLHGGAGTDTITGGTGNDKIGGGDGADVINSGDGSNVIDGGAGADTITGGAGNDTITGGDGADVMTGGTGADEFVFTSASQSDGTSATDTIADFSTGVDVLTFSGLTGADATLTYLGDDGNFTGTGASEAYFNTTHNKLVIDVDGDGTADIKIKFTGLTTFHESDINWS